MGSVVITRCMVLSLLCSHMVFHGAQQGGKTSETLVVFNKLPLPAYVRQLKAKTSRSNPQLIKQLRELSHLQRVSEEAENTLDSYRKEVQDQYDPKKLAALESARAEARKSWLQVSDELFQKPVTVGAYTGVAFIESDLFLLGHICFPQVQYAEIDKQLAEINGLLKRMRKDVSTVIWEERLEKKELLLKQKEEFLARKQEILFPQNDVVHEISWRQMSRPAGDFVIPSQCLAFDKNGSLTLVDK